MTLYDFLYDLSKSMTKYDRYDLVQTLYYAERRQSLGQQMLERWA